ncbi:hypothetical protein FHG87_002624 [Trinorchestia longiramus]|nr:hypothetical protein FHG87_002624 [Trinorchestia longiramus]
MSGAGDFFPSVSSEGNHLHALSAVPINEELADDERDVLKEFVELCPVDGVTQDKTLAKHKLPCEKQKKKRKGSFGSAADVSLTAAANAAASGMLSNCGDYNAPCGTVFAPGMYHFLDPKSGSSVESMIGTTPKMEEDPDHDDSIDPGSFRKLLRQRGLSYVSRQGKLVPPATFKFERCFCTNECHTLPEEDRREIFENFWLLGSWDVQSAFLRSHMVEVPVKDNPKTAAKKRRTRVVHYYLKDTRVCKKTFANTLCVTQSRLDYLITAKAAPCGALIQDMRGRKIPGNKIPDITYTKINEFLSRFPKYKSVHSRDKVYFHSDLTKKELHQRFCEEYPEHSISMFIFRQALKRYNIEIYSLDSDSCSKCDRFSSKRKANMSFEERVQLAEESHHHEQKTTEARTALKKCETVVRSDPRHLCFTFSLGKTQSLPHLSIPVAVCKRRMWLFNLGINDRRDNSTYLCMWTEVDGKCGSDEVASCILEYLNRRPLNSYSAISTFSDSFGGTNWKKTFIALQMYVCGTSAVESWTHTFLESGHSLLPNDADFAKIEKSKKIKENIYDYDHWTLNMMECRFNILHMKNRFLKVSQLTNLHAFREIDFYHEPFSWSDVKWLRVARGNTVVEFKTSLVPDHPSRWVDLAKALPNERVGTLEKLHLQPIKISKEKYMDILSLGEYLPAPSYNYYKSTPHKDRDGGVEHFPGEEIRA